MVKTYLLSVDGKKVLSPLFSVYEFSSTSPSPYSPTKTYSDKVLISEELISALEQLCNTMGVTKTRISSGYRTPEHDKAVGGNGRGQHTYGKAVDICFYGKDGKIIDTRFVSCIAQDLGVFNGIARISTNYIHLDVGNRVSKYLGDETKSYNTVTKNFYSYYGLTKAQVSKYIAVPYELDKNKKTKPTISYQVYTNKWLPYVSNSTKDTVKDYAGIENKPIHALRIKVDNGSFKYRVHMAGINSWTEWIETSDKDFAGVENQALNIDAIEIDNTGFGFDIDYYVSVLERASYYPTVRNRNDYAGSFGKSIDKVVIYIGE